MTNQRGLSWDNDFWLVLGRSWPEAALCLRQVQWGGPGRTCQACGAREREGHTEECTMYQGAMLASEIIASRGRKP